MSTKLRSTIDSGAQSIAAAMLFGAIFWIVSDSLHWSRLRAKDDERRLPRILFMGTKEYDAIVKEFPITASEAKRYIVQFQRTAEGETLPAFRLVTGSHCILIDDEYVFELPPNKRGIALTGYYVHAKTGEVRRVEEEGVDDTLRRQFPKAYIPWAKAVELGCPESVVPKAFRD